MAGKLPIGARISSYRILEVLGEGGMGVVYRARDERLGREVALKVIARERCDERFLVRFRREARAGAAIEHPNVARVYEVGEDGGVPFLVVELVPGGTLRDLVKKQGKLRWRFAVQLATQVAYALSAVHAAGIVHRDLKPANVLIDADGKPKLADFGLAHLNVATDDGGPATKTGELIGTLQYIAPEQAEGRKGIDARADLYGLGCMLYELLTGKPPFDGTGLVLVKKHLVDAPRPPREVVPEIPEALEDLVLRLLAKRPEARPSSAETVALELEDIATEESGERDAPARKPPRRSSRAPLALALAGGLLAAGGALAGVFIPWQGASGPAPPPPPPPPAPAPPPVKNAVEPPPDTKAATAIDRETLHLVEAFRKTPRTELVRVLGSYRWRHSSGVTCLAPLPDGKRVLSAAQDQTMRLWEIATGRELRVFHGHLGHVNWVDVSPDGRQALSASADKSARLWDVETGKELKVLRSHADVVVSAAFRPGDPRRGMTASDDGTIKLWDLETGIVEDTLEGHRFRIARAAFTADGKRIFSGDESGELKLWDVSRVPGREIAPPLPSHGGRVESVACSPSTADRAISAGANGAVRYLFFSTREVFPYSMSSPVHAVAISPDGALAATGSADGIIRILDLAKSQNPFHKRLHANGVFSLAFDRSGTRLLSGGEDGAIQLWTVDGLRRVEERPAGHETAIHAIAVSRDGSRALTGGIDATVRLWDLTTGAQLELLLPHHESVSAVLLTPDGSGAISGARDGTLVNTAIATRKAVMSLAEKDPLQAAAISPSGATVAAGYRSGKVRVLRFGGGMEWLPESPGTDVTSLAFASESRLVVGRGDGNVDLYDTATSRFVVSWKLHGTAVMSLAASPDGRRFLTGSLDETALLVRLPDGHVERTLRCGARVFAVGLLPGERALTGTEGDGLVQLWDLAGEKELDRIDLRTTTSDWPRSIAVLPQGQGFLVGTARGVLLDFRLVDAGK